MKQFLLAITLVSLCALAFNSHIARVNVRAEKRDTNRVEPTDGFVRGRVLVKFRDGTGRDHARQVIAALGARDADEIPNIGVHVLDLPYQASERAFVNSFKARPEVEFAELDRLVAPDEVVPNDPMYPASEAWPLRKVAAPSAWSITTGSSDIVIAILDTGVDGAHEDLAAKMVPGRNIVNNNSDTRDVHGHGTKVAGTAAASSNNNVGVTAISWGSRIMPIRVADSTGYATFSAIASGLTWAADNGARVANISFYVSDSSSVTTAAKYLRGKGGVVCASAGNSGALNSGSDNAYMLTVSATDELDAPSFFSNYGNNIDFAAPEAAFTTANGGGYTYAGGTSFSAPMVAGIVSLVLSANPALTPTDVLEVLKQSADDLGPTGRDLNYGWGRVNAARAVAVAAGNPLPTDTSAPSVIFNAPAQNAIVSGVVSVDVAAADNVGVSSVTFSVDGTVVSTDIAAPYVFAFDTTARTNGIHIITATARDAAGNTSSATINLTISNFSDTTLPVVSITSPVADAKLDGNVTVTFKVVDDVGVSSVQLYVDGKLVATSAASPFSLKLNSRKLSGGPHYLQAKAVDVAGNLGVSSQVRVFK